MDKHARRLLLLFSDTGGGHRSAAYAVAKTLQQLYGERAQIELVDPLAEYATRPFNRLDKLYPHMVRLRGWPWAAGYHLSDGPRRTALLMRSCCPLLHTAMLQLLRDHPADVIVCCHALFSDPLLRTLTETGAATPLVTLVTDLIATHALWYVPGVNRCLVPTQHARQQALARGMPAEHILVTGLPVGPHFTQAAQEDPRAMRQRLGLEPDQPVVLLVAGAEGMGPLHRLCRRVAYCGEQAQLVIIAGRNERLRARLAAETWPTPVRVDGFVHNMHEWMRAADLLVTKAGPGTISEALVMALPMVLIDALPGQEQPNVDYVVQAGAGVWAPTPGQAAMAVYELLSSDRSSLERMRTRARALAQPNAAQRVAEAVWATANEELAR